MSRKLQIKRGAKAALPALAVAELAMTTDEKTLYYGTGAENIPVARLNHSHTAAEVGAAPASHSHTAAQVGAAPASHSHTAAQVGAAPASHSHTAAQVGALPAQVGATGQVLGFTAPNTVGAMDAPKGGGAYDVVIRTQAEFNALIASPTWLGAVSVCFIGNGGMLKFTRSDGRGCKIPQTVKQIQGVNSATIEVTNFAQNVTADNGALFYETLPTTDDYWITGLTVKASGSQGFCCGFCNCKHLTNCLGSAYGVSASGNAGTGYGFYKCECIINCNGEGSSTSLNYGSNESVNSYGCGFHTCVYLINCNGVGRPSGQSTFGYASGYGFYGCSFLVNCDGFSDGQARYGLTSYGFYQCSQMGNCVGTGAGSCDGAGGKLGCGINECNYINGCKQGKTPSITSFLGGANTKVDTATVVAS